MAASDYPLDKIIQESRNITNLRTVILEDQSKSYFVYGRFFGHYDSETSQMGLDAYFDKAFRELSVSTLSVYTEDQLPILSYTGKHHVTVVTKTKTGQIVMRDALDQSVEAHMGVGG